MKIQRSQPPQSVKDKPYWQQYARKAIKKRNEQEPVNGVIQGRVDCYA